MTLGQKKVMLIKKIGVYIMVHLKHKTMSMAYFAKEPHNHELTAYHVILKKSF